MIVALFGRSATGKTTLAKLIGNELAAEVRHCGNALRIAATAAGSTIEDASDDVHRSVDRETLEWCERIRDGFGVLDGRFLDRVVSGRPDVTFVEICAAPSIRALRWAERLGSAFDEQDLARVDARDDSFSANMYRLSTITRPLVTIDTTGGGVQENGPEICYRSSDRRGTRNPTEPLAPVPGNGRR
jgi:cytidylate kinase